MHTQNISVATDGTQLMLDSWAHAYTYSSGLIATDTVTDPRTGFQYRKTYTWSGSTLTSETAWVKQ